MAPIQHGAGGAPNQSLFPATGQPSGLGLSAGATGQPSGLGLSAGAPGAGFGAGATNTGFGAGAGGWPGAGQTAFGTTSQFPNINKFNAAGGMIGSYNTGGYLPYAGGGYMPYYGMAGGGYVPGIVGVGRGMGR